MKLEEYLAANAATETESEWLDFSDVAIPSGQMIVVDPIMYPDGLVVSVQPGTYHLQVVVAVDSGHVCIARLRAYSDASHSLGTSVGKVSADFSRIGVGDNEAISQIRSAVTQEMVDDICQTLANDDGFGVVQFNPEQRVFMPFITPGDGGGVYDVNDLNNGSLRVGIQIDFFAGIE